MFYLRFNLVLLTLLSLPSLAAATIVISEVLADPPEGQAGDANRDGQYDPHEDEFIELYNAGSRRISLAGWRLGGSGSLSNYFRFPNDAVIEPRSYVVLFGGGNPLLFTVPVYTDDGTIGDGLTDTGEAIHLLNKRGNEVAFLYQSTWPDDQSLVRSSGEYVPHKTASPVEELFSPGYAPEARPLLNYPLFISEVLADPPEGLEGDANRDGQYDPHEDEFIELYNAGPIPISLAGWRLGDEGSLRDYFRFPRNAIIEPGSYVVLFGGGDPSGFTVPVYTHYGTIGDGLTDTGEAIHLIDDHGSEAAFLHQSTWPDDQSLVRVPPDSSALVPHKTASPTEAPFSPGEALEPRPVLTYPIFISEVLADPPEGSEGDANRDGTRDKYKDEFIELYNAGTNTISLAGWRLGDSSPLKDHFRFPDDAVVEPGSYVVLFGGGKPSGFTVPVYIDDGAIGNGLTDTGEAIYLIDRIGGIVDSVSHDTWPDDQSIVRTASGRQTHLSRTKLPRRRRPPSLPETPQKRSLNLRPKHLQCYLQHRSKFGPTLSTQLPTSTSTSARPPPST